MKLQRPHPRMMSYAMQWAERLLEGGGNEQWGDKWEERFKDGSGGKQVCTWHLFMLLPASSLLAMLLLHHTAILTL